MSRGPSKFALIALLTLGSVTWLPWASLAALAQGSAQPGAPAIDWGPPVAETPSDAPGAQKPPETATGAPSSPLAGGVGFEGAPAPSPPLARPSGFPRPGTNGSVLVEEAQPREYWLPGKSGTLQPVINIPFEVFEKIYAQLQTGNQPPPYSLLKFRLAGSVGRDRAELGVEVEAQVSAGAWIPIALGLDEAAILSDSVVFGGTGRFFLSFDDKKGYVWWVLSEKDEVQKLSFRIAVPIQRAKEVSELRLLTPQAVSTEASLELPEAEASVEVGEGVQLRALESVSGATRVELMGVGGSLGRGGQLSIKWRSAAGKPSPAGLGRLEVSAKQLVQLLTEHALTTAELQLRPLGGPVSQVDILLPAGAELLPGESALPYQVVPVQEGESSSDRGAHRLVFTEPITGPTLVSLTWRQMFGRPGEPVSLGIRGVKQAVRHFGVVVVSGSAWRSCQWELSGDIRRIEAQVLPDFWRKGEEVLAAFEYYSERHELRMKCGPEKTQIVVSPEYELVVGADYARLTAKWRLFVRGVPATELEVAANGWQIEQFEPEALLAPEVVLSELAETEVLHLSQPLVGSCDVRLTARRKLDASSGRIRLPLLLPRADVITTGMVIVRCDENVEVLVDLTESKGFARQVALPGPELSGPPARGYFRWEPASAERPVVVLDRWVYRQEVTVSSEATVTLRPGMGSVEQRLEYEIAYQPLQHLTFALPASLARSNGIEFLLDGQRVIPLSLPSEAFGNGDEGELAWRRVLLPEPRLGRVELVFRARLAVPYLPPRASARLTVPLIVPREGAWRQNRVRLLVEEGIRVQPRAGVWKGAMDSFGWIDGPEVVLLADEGVAELPVALHRPGGRGIIVERAWIQSFVGTRSRQDRAVFRLVTAEPDIEIDLPPGADPEETWAAVAVNSPENVQKIRTEVTPAGSLQVFLPEHQPGQRLFLEIVYRLPGQLRQFQPVEISLPQIRGEAWVQQVYWQLVLPPQWHIVAEPAGWFGEYRLAFRGGFLRRDPAVDEGELATWAGAIRSQKIPDTAEIYLFSRQDGIGSAKVVFARRPIIVTAASGCVLLLGLALVYRPGLRRPWILLSLGAVIAAGTIVQPDYAVLAGQAGLLGVVLVGLAAFLQRIVTALGEGRETGDVPGSAMTLEEAESAPLAAGGGLTGRSKISAPTSSVLP
ncbi:MAG: hypothetical protein NZ899_01910 [Thermoguttaceae bacterium]|nr:hypothetical protein [Thermoguttaceae bacterium]